MYPVKSEIHSVLKLRNVVRYLCKLTTICLPRFSPALSQFTDKISPVCLPQIGDEDRLPAGAQCYASGKYSYATFVANYMVKCT